MSSPKIIRNAIKTLYGTITGLPNDAAITAFSAEQQQYGTLPAVIVYAGGASNVIGAGTQRITQDFYAYLLVAKVPVNDRFAEIEAAMDLALDFIPVVERFFNLEIDRLSGTAGVLSSRIVQNFADTPDVNTRSNEGYMGVRFRHVVEYVHFIGG